MIAATIGQLTRPIADSNPPRLSLHFHPSNFLELEQIHVQLSLPAAMTDDTHENQQVQTTADLSGGEEVQAWTATSKYMYTFTVHVLTSWQATHKKNSVYFRQVNRTCKK